MRKTRICVDMMRVTSDLDGNDFCLESAAITDRCTQFGDEELLRKTWLNFSFLLSSIGVINIRVDFEVI